jgi:hypothetical protein
MKAQILKSMIVNGRKLVAGEIVEVKGWRHAKSLANNRYIKLIEDEVPKVEVPKVETPKVEKPKVAKIKEEIREISLS